MKKHVFITGGAGYLGSILCEHLLDKGYRVTVLDSLMYGEQNLNHLCANPDFDFHRGDARDEKLVGSLIRDADVLIPLAAIVGAPACDLDPLMASSTNRDAIAMLCRIRRPEQLIIYPTTNSGYGTKTGDVFCTEESSLDPISLYGRTKCEAEEIVLAAGNSITLRLATVFGMSPRPRLDLLVNHFTYAAFFDGYLVIFEKDFKRNYVHIRDVADCFIHCIENPARMTGRPFNVGLDAANLSKEELALKIKEHIPRFYLHFSEVGSDPDKRNYIVSNQRLADVGFVARRSLDEGIRELIKGYRLIGRMPCKNI
ncbi:NAD-dependent epimerase/dehydratase family protein [Trichlorobacter lovleyi]|uniref:NAD-dependent epimerase/dehydratase n=1 Tax=Trichlorobacter lovleyi (strain ATCC BAA-1151 / DSM 17278 / SZ) TaxID=398767 RepID=B3E4V5_TRIL1|nr:NAD(P)-dependent oxidoreductase [Trichlorobacter lovleyi]ACD94520.1 NAD-dependent epimerase/dehydratase [Trichlorobacter lovleyi SZ]